MPNPSIWTTGKKGRSNVPPPLCWAFFSFGHIHAMRVVKCRAIGNGQIAPYRAWRPLSAPHAMPPDNRQLKIEKAPLKVQSQVPIADPLPQTHGLVDGERGKGRRCVHRAAIAPDVYWVARNSNSSSGDSVRPKDSKMTVC